MNNVKFVGHLLPLLFIMGLVGLAQAGDASFNNLPQQGTSLADFIPRGWKVDSQVSGDLNGDGVPDIAAILIEDKPDNDADDGPKHAFMVLLSDGNSKFVLAGINSKLLQCKGCGGVKEFVDIQIKKDVVIVSQMSGSRTYTYNTWRFRYDHKSQRFVLIGLDCEDGDNVLGKKTIESSNYLTGLKTIRKGNKVSSSTIDGFTASQQAPFLEDVAE
jgi:hypothetical protein